MKRSVATILAVAGFAACFDDPTSALRGGASRVRLSLNRVFVAPQESVTVSGTLLDDQGNPIPGTLSFASADAAVATAGDLPGDTVPGLLESSGYVVGQLAGATYVRVTSGGVSDSIYVVVVPAMFTGTVAPATANVGDTITVTVPASITFDTANAAVTVDGAPAFVVAKTAAAIRIIAGASAGGTLHVEGLVLLGSISLPGLDATTTVTVTETGEPANDAPGGVTVTLTGTSAGSPLVQFGSVDDASDIDDLFTFTLAAPATVVLQLQMNGGGAGGVDDPDIDLLVCNAACNAFVGGFGGATGANPENLTLTNLAAGTYHIIVEGFDTGGATSVYKLIAYLQ